MAYILDANVFIQAKNLHYGFDFCPAFWDWVLERHEQGQLFSVSQVGDELLAGDDELSVWAKERSEIFFRPTDAPTLPSLATVAQWVTSQRFDPAAINTFLQVADYYVVSFAHAHGHVVVTHERPADSIKKIKIPNVCVGVGVQFLNPFDMLRRERARFVLPHR